MTLMDSELQRTVEAGDIENLIKLCETRSHEFFLGQDHEHHRNMLHILSVNGKQAFAEEALRRLPIQVVSQLICQPDSNGDNPLHLASSCGSFDIAKLLVDAYNRSSGLVDDPSHPPWRSKNGLGKLPVQVAARYHHDELAAFLVSVDPDFLCSDDADSLLDSSIHCECRQTFKAILTSGVRYSTESCGLDLVNHVAEYLSENDAILLLEKHPELVKRGDFRDKVDFGRFASRFNMRDLVRTVLNIDISVFNSPVNEYGESPFFFGMDVVIVKVVVDAFKQFFERQLQRVREAAVRTNSRRSFEIQEHPPPASVRPLSFQPPWRQAGKRGLTIVHLILDNVGDRDLAASMLSSDLLFVSYVAAVYEDHQSNIIPLILQNGFEEAGERYMKPDTIRNMMDIHLEVLSLFLREHRDFITRKFLNQYPEVLKCKDASGQTVLQYALNEKDVDTISFILNIQPSAAVFEDQCTALHDVRWWDLEDYRSLLRCPQIAQLKNKTDALGRSPLIKAIQADDVYLAQALLELDGIDVMNIRNSEGKTAAALRKDKSRESDEWDVLYKKPRQATSFVPLGTDLKEMRNTLSVVAALLATIIFAAAFTVPGGFDQNTGDVLLGQRVSFIVFILSDTYAMCCSMIVLSSLIWSMVWESEKALVLIERSVYVLHQSLYGILVAFMTGVYTMMSHKSLWVAIVVCIMCSCVPISANRTILVNILDKFVPTSGSRSGHGHELTEISIQR